jgi:CheY-like chemotaxis protein
VSQVRGQVTGYGGARKRVLVVDDTEANRSVLTETLESLGFEVSEAVNGLEALTFAKAAPPDLILMDIRMPVMNGIEAMLRLQEIPSLSTIPIVAVSAGVTQVEQAEGIKAGAKAFLRKPIETPYMLQEIGRLLQLTWIHEGSGQAMSPVSDRADQFVVPEPAQMESLRELAKAGNMRALKERAAQLTALDARYRPFAERISELALGYQSKAVLRLVEKHATQKMEEQVAQS